MKLGKAKITNTSMDRVREMVQSKGHMSPEFICNWCGGTEFDFPEYTQNNYQIVCTECFSKPRQRCLKSVLDENRLPEWQDYNVLQLSPDLMSMIGNWFRAVEVSVFEGDNSIDLENANRADNTYDIITCVHVLEHVKDETKAITELIRMLTPSGQLYLMVPQPAAIEITQDWGYPDEDNFGHYRLYGKDFTKKLQSTVQAVADLELFEKVDTVTGKKEFVYVITKKELRL